MEPRIAIPHAAIEDFCRRWSIVEFSLFGSVLRDDFHADSDIDVLVRFAEGTRYGLFAMVHMQDELEGLFGRRVDLVTKRAVEESRNPYRRNSILETAQVLYAP